MVRNIIFAALVALAITIYALIECVRTRPNDVRSLPKTGWILAIVLLPLLGAGLWFWLGRPLPSNYQRPTQGPRPSSGAPDDDEAFLRNLETQRRNKARDEEFLRREAELKERERKLAEEAKKREEGGNPSEDTPRHTP
ncbi:hypothetical protein CQ018_03045 [Arthrobacter sp. MYb227]|uniref:PLD nuclease N-terminal domain-containing protein n=1 Tax=Arthrobacter sp. MYb227 TaxID=1848601 RepID=UPI000CFD68F2|nr:PLD nuclease N-terminal domain-containing protein [Arthrobacter sp. MYb227]PQZ96264.1 hypothetical protein CQ018_03045 [Arthrobacter sp. MYb227]